MILEVLSHVLRTRTAIEPALHGWPFLRLHRLQVLFPDIGRKPVPHLFGFLTYEGESLLSQHPLAFMAVVHVREHTSDLTTLEK